MFQDRSAKSRRQVTPKARTNSGKKNRNSARKPRPDMMGAECSSSDEPRGRRRKTKKKGLSDNQEVSKGSNKETFHRIRVEGSATELKRRDNI